MKAVMLSVRPQWCELICNGKKTIEVRKTRPKLGTPFKCYIYCTVGGDALCPPHMNCSKWDIHRQNNGAAKGRKMTTAERGKSDYRFANGKVIGEFVCDGITNLFADSRFWLDEKAVEQSCLTGNQIREYANGKESIYGWHISGLQIYDKPRELSEFSRFGFFGMGYSKVICGNYGCKHFMPSGNYDEPPDCDIEGCTLTRPPESWCYVEELT